MKGNGKAENYTELEAIQNPMTPWRRPQPDVNPIIFSNVIYQDFTRAREEGREGGRKGHQGTAAAFRLRKQLCAIYVCISTKKCQPFVTAAEVREGGREGGKEGEWSEERGKEARQWRRERKKGRVEDCRSLLTSSCPRKYLPGSNLSCPSHDSVPCVLTRRSGCPSSRRGQRRQEGTMKDK
ncbi:hypothetical protein E2C01_075631 [Portunus trituberculatus]|uniref:Uncharacterized protein n=1 Tax=Portunus trituberculatus TaxID=210409 RepID=A0A5B7I6K8_PORTR|nr:hypothetical protein [Portunus trituberculatus]